ncbi:MAG: hypothetical protein ACI4TX_05130 [Christensenellales bacterium]
MKNLCINNSNEIVELLKQNEKDKLYSQLYKFCEGYDALFKVLKALVEKGFITTSCSKGHNNDKWKDSVYIAFYVDYANVKKVLNLIYQYNLLLTDDEKNLITYSCNFNSVTDENNISVEYMFGLQIDVFDDNELKVNLLNKILKALEQDLLNNEIALDYNFIYLVNRFIHYDKYNTNWLNISFNVREMDEKFSLIFKKNAQDKYVVEKQYTYNNLSEFEYLLNY